MAFQFLQLLAALDVPQAKRLVRAEGEDLLTVRGEDARRLFRVALQFPQFLAGFHVPEPYRLVVTPGEEPLAVGGDGAMRIGLGVACELARELARGEVPEVDVIADGVAHGDVLA